MNELGESELDAIRSRFQERVAKAVPDLLPLAGSVLNGLDAVNWALEWHLPRWLGDWLGIEREVSDELILGNVLGLASLRLQDDLRDDEVTAATRADAGRLAAALYEAALDTYRRLMPAHSLLWPELERLMQAWQDAHEGQPDHARLAGRGAPLKICAFAVCELAQRIELYPRLDRCLDEALTAMVLYDHAVDWPADVAAGRWNALVVRASSGAPSADAQRTRTHILAAMMTTEIIGEHFADVHAAFARAERLADELAIPGLADFLRRKMLDIDAQAETMAAEYRGLGDKALRAFVASHPPDLREEI